MSLNTLGGRKLRANTPRAAAAKGKGEMHLAKSLQEDHDSHKLSPILKTAAKSFNQHIHCSVLYKEMFLNV